jgi:signal peptidase I
VIRKAEHYRASGKASNKKWRRMFLASVLVVLVAVLFQLVLRQLFFYPLRITSDAMAPEVKPGDKRYFVYPKLTSTGKGDIVLVKSMRADVEMLCRIVATDGDRVQIKQGKLTINGSVEREMAPRTSDARDLSFELAETEVRPNFFFCLNDNHLNTNDSRAHGIFARNQIVAKAFKPFLLF